jgi:hypothetical protein
MASKLLTELIEETNNELIDAEAYFAAFPGMLSSIRLVETLDKAEKLQEIYDSITVKIESKPKRKRLQNKT